MKLQAWMDPADLAPGDKKSAHADMSRVELHRIASADDPLFGMAFGALWAEFGHSGEIESAEILAGRLLRESPDMRYEMILLTSGGKFAAACDHTVIVRADQPGALVHISHNLVAPHWRRTGLAGWLRALSVSSARNVLAAQGRQEFPITVIGEVEYLDHSHAGNVGRLHAYEKAGYKKIDPARVRYFQPDFRAADQIALGGGPVPLPLCLVIRRVGHEDVDFITGAEMRQIVASIYSIFALDFSQQVMACVYESLNDYPAPDEKIALIPPSSA